MRIKWNDSGQIEDRARADALRMIRRGRAVLAEEEPPKPEPKAVKPKPQVKVQGKDDADSN